MKIQGRSTRSGLSDIELLHEEFTLILLFKYFVHPFIKFQFMVILSITRFLELYSCLGNPDRVHVLTSFFPSLSIRKLRKTFKKRY